MVITMAKLRMAHASRLGQFGKFAKLSWELIECKLYDKLYNGQTWSTLIGQKQKGREIKTTTSFTE